tara:strand:- start:171 stop:362 length:192 start_codon:yes stop_codon:yes gene_type:complete
MFNPLAIIQSLIGTLFNIWVNIWVIGFLFISFLLADPWEIILGFLLGVGIIYYFYKYHFNAKR